MNSPYSSDDQLHQSDEAPEREISLGASTVLGIFFALALVCALFFGFGYTTGRRSAQVLPAPQATSQSTSQTAPSGAASTGSKPSSGSLASTQSSASPATTTRSSAPADASSAASDQRNPPADFPHNAATTVTQSLAPSTVRTPEKPSSPSAAASSPRPTTTGYIVQIAAVSHHEDADILISTLTRRGYDVAIHQEPQDKLLHVQIGPFANRKDAEAMRLRLLADGYNAIVK